MVTQYYSQTSFNRLHKLYKRCDWLLFQLPSYGLLSISKLSLHYHKTNVKKVYLVSVFKSQENLLCNQYSDQSDGSLQKVQISLPYR